MPPCGRSRCRREVAWKVLIHWSELQQCREGYNTKDLTNVIEDLKWTVTVSRCDHLAGLQSQCSHCGARPERIEIISIAFTRDGAPVTTDIDAVVKFKALAPLEDCHGLDVSSVYKEEMGAVRVAYVYLGHSYSSLEVEVSACFMWPESGSFRTALPLHLRTFQANMMNLWVSGKNSDVVFVLGDKTVCAHSQILIACSEVFSAMFSHNTKDNAGKRIHVEDVQICVFIELMCCLYTGQEPAWEKERALENEFLLDFMYVVEKYSVEWLQPLCRGRLLDTVTPSNIVNRLKAVHLLCPSFVSEMLQHRDVKISVGEAVSTKAWTDLEVEYPALVIQVLKALYVKKRRASFASPSSKRQKC